MITAQLVAEELVANFPDARRWIVAFSGGVDSHVLLHLLATADAGNELVALHVNHGLHADADRWQEHCAQVSAGLGVRFVVERISVKPGTRRGLERAAREARYRVFEALTVEGDLLVQAHHRDDQAETVLLRLLRGAGPVGLSGIPRERTLGRARLARPLLGFSREALLDYARGHALRWIEDPSNRSSKHDRNFLRHELMPLLQDSWPEVDANLARVAQACQEAQSVSDSLAAEDLAERIDIDRFGHHRLATVGLRQMPGVRLRNLLRYWLRQIAELTPSRVQLERLCTDLIGAREDASPRLRIGRVDLRRFRRHLYFVSEAGDIDSNQRFTVSGPGLVDLGAAGRLRIGMRQGEGLRVGERIEIGFRTEALRCRLEGARGSYSLKRQLQELGVPPWLRRQLPLVFVNDELAALADLALCEGYRARPGEDGLVFDWEPSVGKGSDMVAA